MGESAPAVRLRVLDLFSGIGGFSLGLERAGMQTVAFCEIEPFCRAVLKKHWPSVPFYDDIRTLTAERLASDGIAADVICGGFPCQDISVAGKGAGIEGSRSGLWSEYARLIGELRPRYVIVENVAALLGRGISRVLGDLSALGYDAEWEIISAADVGAPHRRERVWIVAYPRHSRILQRGKFNDACKGVEEQGGIFTDGIQGISESKRKAMADANSTPGERDKRAIGSQQESANYFQHCRWEPEPGIHRVADGIPNRAHRLKGLGNAVVPKIPEIIGRAIVEASK